MPDRFPARIDGFGLDMETIEDTFTKSIAKYEFPYSDGALLEDIGQKARTIRVRCYFYNETYEEHFKFINHLESRELFELVHPQYGLMKGCIETVSVRHDAREETAEIDLSFVENLRGSIEVKIRPAVDDSCEAAYNQSIDEQKAVFFYDMREAIGQAAAVVAAKALDPDQGILEQFTGLTRTVSEYVKSVDTYVRGLETTLNDIANPANSLISTIDFGVNLPGRVIGAAARTAERYSLLFDSIKNAPVRFVQSFRDGMTKLENSLGYPKHTRSAKASRAALDLGYIYRDDETNRNKARTQEKAKSFNTEGKYVKSEPMPVLLTADEIELSLYLAREMLQSSIDEEREMQSLKDLALLLQEHAYQVKIESEKLLTISVDNETPLHLICLMRGLPYQYAERIHSVNKIKNPNFVRGDVRVYAR